jgi:hypothetical protein
MYFKRVLRFFNLNTDTWPTVAIFEGILKKTHFLGGGRDTCTSTRAKTIKRNVILSFFSFVVQSGSGSNSH